MKVAMFAVAVVCASIVSSVFAGESVSVLQHSAPTIAEPQAAAPAAQIITPAMSACGNCAEGVCATESTCRGSCRAGLFGRTIERTRTVTRAVVEVPVRVVTAPVRVLRANRSCCGCCR